MVVHSDAIWHFTFLSSTQQHMRVGVHLVDLVGGNDARSLKLVVVHSDDMSLRILIGD